MRTVTPFWTTSRLTTDLFDDMDQVLQTWANHRPAYDERAFNPPCEISETSDHYLMSVDLPGMKIEDIKIEVVDQVLTVSGERKREVSESKMQRYEKSYGFFKRSFTLPTSIQGDQVEARYENGVLELYLPKTQAAKPRKIEIQTGKSGIFDKLLESKR